ncbi:MAG: tetratricopeptide repeat protein, partial [Bacteroidetes bacterium]|nr:tetratricopeptide repeat protein [Bacteroidota bacterium]
MFASLKYYLFACFFGICVLGKGQSEKSLIDSAYHYYDLEQIDQAEAMFEQVANLSGADNNTKLEAISGLLKIAVFLVELNQADSLQQIGDNLLENNKGIDASSKLRFWQAKAENLRKASRFNEALKLHQQVLKESRKLKNDSLLQAYAHLYVAATFERLSQNDSALNHINIAIQQFENLLPSEHVKLGSVYNLAGACYYRKGDISQAENFYQKAIATLQKNVEGPSYIATMAYGNLAACATAQEDYQGAIRYNQKALAFNKQLDEQDGMSFNYYSIAVAYYYLGDYGRSKDYLNACLDIRRKIYGNENHYRFAGPYEVLGIAYEESGNYEKAIEHLKKAKAIKLAILGTNSVEVAYSNENIAICNLQLGSPDSAYHYIQLATPILEKNLPGQYQLGTHFFTLSRVFIALGNYNEALKTLEKSSQIYRQLGLENSLEYAQNSGVKALIFSKQKKFAEAQQMFEASLKNLAINNSLPYNNNSFPLNAVSLDILSDVIEHSFNAYSET